MRRWVIGLFCLLSLGATLIFVFLQLPDENYSPVLKEFTEASNSRNRKLQQEAVRPEINGYLAPKFVTFWDQPGGQDDTKVGAVLMAWNQYSSATKGKRVDHSLLQRDPGYLEALQGFVELWPDLSKSLQKPLFIKPTKAGQLNTPGPNFISLGDLRWALGGYAEYLAANNQSDEVAEVILLLVGTGRKFSDYEHESGKLCGLAYLAQAFETYVTLFGPTVQLSANEMTELAKKLDEEVPSSDGVDHFLEDILTYQIRWSEAVLTGKISLNGQATTFPMDLLMARDIRILKHQSAALIQAERDNELEKVLGEFCVFSVPSYFFGKCGLTSKYAFLGLANSMREMEYRYLQMVGIQRLTSLRAYIAVRGNIPDRLDSIGELGLSYSEVPGITFNEGVLRLEFSPDVLQECHDITASSNLKHWMKITPTGFEFDLKVKN